jgi:hypothetical protein
MGSTNDNEARAADAPAIIITIAEAEAIMGNGGRLERRRISWLPSTMVCHFCGVWVSFFL